MQYLVDNLPIIISMGALGVSVLAYVHSIITKKKALGYEYASLKITRNALFESKLATWKEAFDLYGIDLDEAANDGVTEKHIAYLVLCLDAQSATATALGISVFEYISQSRWRKNMYSQDITVKTWKYAKILFEDFTVKDVDKYLKSLNSKII